MSKPRPLRSIFAIPGLLPYWCYLKKAGLTYLHQIPDSTDQLLQIMSEVSANKMLEVIQEYNKNIPMFTSAETLSVSFPKQQIGSFCKIFDSAIGGGICLGSITELAGQPGVGKTQACIQWCVTVQWPVEFGGLRGRALYLDCDANFFPERAQQIAAAKIRANPRIKAPFDESVKLFLDGILYRRIDSLEDLISTLNLLKNGFLQSSEDVRLIVVDSLAFHFRYPMLKNSGASQTHCLHSVMQTLNFLAEKHNLAVVVTNQVTSVSRDEPRVDSSSLIPALGESFSHAATSRIWLEYVPGVDPVRVRSVKLLKSSHCIVKRNPGKFRITQDGIKDA